jgi:hypothetical protein
MSVFDSLRVTAFNTVNAVMGDACSWTPGAGGSAITAKVLFSEVDEPHMVADAEYQPGGPCMEYKAEDLTGLYAAVQTGATETVNVAGANYYVRSVKATEDGKCYKAYLEKVSA